MRHVRKAEQVLAGQADVRPSGLTTPSTPLLTCPGGVATGSTTMRRSLSHARAVRQSLRHYGTAVRQPPIIQIANGTFYRHHPSAIQSSGIDTNPPLFAGLDLSIPSSANPAEHWAILGPSSAGKTTLLRLLQGQHLCFPPTARSYPYLNSEDIEQKDHRLRIPSRAILYVGFDGEQGGFGGTGTRGTYLSARYESRREITDFSVLDYLKGNTDLNPSEVREEDAMDADVLERVIRDLRLGDLANMPVSNLSNGQTRRARIAKALLGKPEVLLLDEPFMGLDPPTLMSLSPLLHRLAAANDPRMVLTLRPQDPIPDWITHLVYLGTDCSIALQGPKPEVLRELKEYAKYAFAGEHNIKVQRTPSGISIALGPFSSLYIAALSYLVSAIRFIQTISRISGRSNCLTDRRIGFAIQTNTFP